MTGSGLHSLALPYIICRRVVSCEGFEPIGWALFTQCAVVGMASRLPQRVEAIVPERPAASSDERGHRGPYVPCSRPSVSIIAERELAALLPRFFPGCAERYVPTVVGIVTATSRSGRSAIEQRHAERRFVRHDGTRGR